MASSDPTFGALRVRDDVALARVRRAHAETLCAGHFPGDPLLPGSALLGLMASLAARLAGDAPLAVVERCTFRARVRPDRRIVVRARRTAPGRVTASIRVDGRTAARAALRFAS